MEGVPEIDPDFATEWVKLLRRPSVERILTAPLTVGRKISKILCTLAADEYGELEYKWYEETKKVRELNHRIEVVSIHFMYLEININSLLTFSLLPKINFVIT